MQGADEVVDILQREWREVSIESDDLDGNGRYEESRQGETCSS